MKRIYNLNIKSILKDYENKITNKKNVPVLFHDYCHLQGGGGFVYN